MDKRQHYLNELKEYIENIDKETSLLLQNLQWDQKHLLESTAMIPCKYVASHRIPLNTREDHEKQCFLALNGYTKEDVLLPDLVDPEASTVVKLSKHDIMQIINMASSSNPSFRRGVACEGPEPLSLERLQLAYTADERRAVYDAVVSAAPSCHDLADLALASSSSTGAQTSKVKSRAEILAELRDMKRRRTKYRVAAKTRNYSDVLRDVIKTQMELYAEARGISIETQYGPTLSANLHNVSEETHNNNKKVPPPILIKQERISTEGDSYREASRRYREQSRSRDRQYDRHRTKREDRGSKKRKHYDDDDSSSDRRRHLSQDRDKYSSKERIRNDDTRSVRNKYRSKEDSSRDRSKHDQYKNSTDTKQELSDSDYSRRHDDGRYKYSKHDRYYGNGSSNDTNKYDKSSGREHEKRDRSYKDDHYRRKHEDNKSSSVDSDRYREWKRKRYDDVQIKVEKEHYIDHTDD